MIIDSIALTKGLNVAFNKAYKVAPDDIYKPLYEALKSTGDSEKYGWFGSSPALREWVGERHVGSIEDYDYEIKNRDFESTVAVDRNEIEDDKLGIIKKRVQQMAQKAKRFPASLIQLLVEDSLAGLAYDGAAFCSNRAAPNDNLLAGTGVTKAQCLTDLAAARLAMLAFTDDQGEVMNIKGDFIICHPNLETIFMEIMNSTTSPTAGSEIGQYNPWQKILKGVVSDAKLTDLTDWYLAASSEDMKPFILQTRKPPQFVALDKPTDENVFMRKKLLYGVDLRCNAGYGFYRYAVQTVNA